MTNKSKSILKLFIRIAVTAGLLVWVFNSIDLGQLGQNIKAARWQFLIVVWALIVLAFWIRAVRMRLILKRQGCEVESTKVFSASSVAMLYSMILPGTLSTGVKWYILKQHTGKGSNVLSAMMYNQTMEIVVRVLLGLVAIIVTNPGGRWQLPMVCGIITAVIIVGYVLLLDRRTGAKISAAMGYALRVFPKMIRSPAEKILEQIKVFQTTGWAFHLAMAGVSLVASLVSVVIYVCAAKGAGITVPAAALVWQSSVVYILGRLPISVANLGVREFTLIESLALYGVEAPAVLLMSMIIFSCIILMAVIGAIYQLCWAISAKKSAKSS